VSAKMNKPLVCAFCIALSGCTTAVPVVKEALKCNVDPSMLEHCTPPIEITEGITYARIIEIVKEDRSSLRFCAQRQEVLAKAVTDCNITIDQHNKEIREINARNGAGK
jgi:hypothetical protein